MMVEMQLCKRAVLDDEIWLGDLTLNTILEFIWALDILETWHLIDFWSFDG